MSIMKLEEVKEVILVKWDTHEFIDRFEIDIDDLVRAFSDRIREELEVLPYQLDMEQMPDEYEDR